MIWDDRILIILIGYAPHTPIKSQFFYGSVLVSNLSCSEWTSEVYSTGAVDGRIGIYASTCEVARVLIFFYTNAETNQE